MIAELLNSGLAWERISAAFVRMRGKRKSPIDLSLDGRHALGSQRTTVCSASICPMMAFGDAFFTAKKGERTAMHDKV
ncbi:MAG: hypothetical protein C4334_03270 [Pyrinomonas sp.]